MNRFNIPWTLELRQNWPFGFRILDAAGEVILAQDAAASSTLQETREDNEAAIGFDGVDRWSRKAAVQAIATQNATARLWHAAPDLLVALENITAAFMSHTQWAGEPPAEVLAARAAIAKAKGEKA